MLVNVLDAEMFTNQRLHRRASCEPEGFMCAAFTDLLAINTTPTTRIIRSTSERKRGGITQPKAQKCPSDISHKPGTLIATIVAEPITTPGASAINIGTIAANTGEADATTHD